MQNLKPSVALIRALYPNPVAYPVDGDLSRSYCVGGALLRFMGDQAHFPGIQPIADKLMQINPSLSQAAANSYATDITCHNDNGRFEDSWRVLDRALNYRALNCKG